MIYLGADHGGYSLKERIKDFLKSNGYKFKDLGNKKYNEKDDYPDFAFKVAEKVSEEDDPKKPWKERPKGILFCKSSGGMVIAANKVKNVRAVSVFDIESAIHSREHNDANVIALSGIWTNEDEAKKIVEKWLSTEFSNEEKHIRRLKKIKEYENKNFKSKIKK